MPRPFVLRDAPGPGVTVTQAAAQLLAVATRRTLRLDFHDGDQVTMNLPGVTTEALAHLDDDGFAPVGSSVSPGMILISRLAATRKKEEEVDAAIDAAFGAEPGRDGSLRCPPGLFGQVESIEHLDALTKKEVPAIAITIVTQHPLALGDLLELDVGPAQVVSELVETLEGAELLWPGVSGEHEVRRGTPLATDVLHARSIGPYSLVSQQPLGGRESFGGQRVTTAEFEALLDRDAPHLVHEMLTVKSDDVAGRFRVYEDIVKGTPKCRAGIPRTAQSLEKMLLALGFDVDVSEQDVAIRLLSDARLGHLAPGQVKKPDTLNYRTLKPEPGGLFDVQTFGALGGSERAEWLGHIVLAVPVLHPWAFDVVRRLLGLTPKAFLSVLRCETTLDGKEAEAAEQTGSRALRAAVQALDLDAPPAGAEADAAALKRSRTAPESLFFTRWPVLPADLRPLVPLEGGRFATSDLNDLYRRVINRNNRTARLIELNAPDVIVRNETRMLQEAVDSLVDNQAPGRRITGPDRRPLVALTELLVAGLTRTHKRVDYSALARATPQKDLSGRAARVPRTAALEVLKPWIYARLEQRGYVTTIKAAKKMVEGRDPVALTFADELAAELPLVLFHEHPTARPPVVSVTATLWDAPSIGLSSEVMKALGLGPGDNVVLHVPIDPAAVAEARALTLEKAPHDPPAQVEGWLAKAARLASPGPLLINAALHGDVDPVKDRRSRLLLARLDD